MVDYTDKILKVVNTNLRKYPKWRFGQTVFNTAYELYPACTSQLRGTDVDPFYKDDQVANFLIKLNELLNR